MGRAKREAKVRSEACLGQSGAHLGRQDMIGHGVRIWGDRARVSVGTKQGAGTRKADLRAEELKGRCVGEQRVRAAGGSLGERDGVVFKGLEWA